MAETEFGLLINLLERPEKNARQYTGNMPNFAELDDVEIVEQVSTAYEFAAYNVGEHVDELDQGSRTDYLVDLQRRAGQQQGAGTAQDKITIFEEALKNKVLDYTVASRIAFNTFFKRMVQGKSAPILGLTYSTRDPNLASDLQSILLNKKLGTYMYGLEPGHQSYFGGYAFPKDNGRRIRSQIMHDAETSRQNTLYRKLHEPSTNLLGALAIGYQAYSVRQQRLHYKETILKPLAEIAVLPPVYLQLLHKALDGISVED